MTKDRKPNWQVWGRVPTVRAWEAVALSLDIDPKKIRTRSHAWMGNGSNFPHEEGQQFEDRIEVLRRNLGAGRGLPLASIIMGRPDYCELHTSDFARWATSLRWTMPAELTALATQAPMLTPSKEPAKTKLAPQESTLPAGHMRRWLKVGGSILGAVLGFAWLVLDFVGTAATVMDLFEWVPIWVRKLAAHDELIYQIGPWILIALSVASLFTVHLWPVSASGTPSSPVEGAKLKREIERNRPRQDKQSLRREELKEDAEFVRGFDPRSDETRQAELLLLSQLRSEGVEIRNDIPDFMTTADLEAWVREVAEWMNDVIAAIKPLSAADAEWFTTLDAVPAARVPIPNVRLGGKNDRELYASTFRQHDYRLTRLEGLLKKYGVGSTN